MNHSPIHAMDMPTKQGFTLYPAALEIVKGRSHRRQDEWIDILSGNLILIFAEKSMVIHAGDSMGFKAGTGMAHQLCNRSETEVTYLEIGDRSAGGVVDDREDDRNAAMQDNGAWLFTHHDGSPYSCQKQR